MPPAAWSGRRIISPNSIPLRQERRRRDEHAATDREGVAPVDVPRADDAVHGTELALTTTRPHRLAREMYVWTWRDGIAHDMFSDANWDFMHHHSAVPRERDFRLRNGDLLQQACVYNSTERTSTTRFGMSTETEMCIAYIDYSVPRNASDLVRKQRAMWNGPLAPGVAVSSAVGPTPPAAGYRRYPA